MGVNGGSVACVHGIGLYQGRALGSTKTDDLQTIDIQRSKHIHLFQYNYMIDFVGIVYFPTMY
jgi:hypothetical protein